MHACKGLQPHTAVYCHTAPVVAASRWHHSLMRTGDYWPGEAETMLANIQEDQRQASRKGNRAQLNTLAASQPRGGKKGNKVIG